MILTNSKGLLIFALLVSISLFGCNKKNYQNSSASISTASSIVSESSESELTIGVSDEISSELSSDIETSHQQSESSQITSEQLTSEEESSEETSNSTSEKTSNENSESSTDNSSDEQIKDDPESGFGGFY